MRIAMIGHKRIPSREGGVEVVVDRLSSELTTRGHSLTVYNRYTGGEKLHEYNGIRIVEVRTFKNSKLNAMVYSLFATLRASFSKCDIVHFHAEGPCAMIWLAKLFGKKCVATIHGFDWQRVKWGGFATKYILFGEKTAVKYADEIIVLSTAAQEYFKKTYDRDTVVIPNGTDEKIPLPPEIIKEKYGLEQNGYLLFLARLTPEKGLHYLLDAYEKINTDKRLVIAGRLDDTTYVAKIRERAASDKRIIMTDFVCGKELEELFSNCFLYILPSDIEGMPMSLLEAICYRARCLVSDIPENTSVAPAYLHTFLRGDADSLRLKLTALLENEDLRQSNFDADGSAEATDIILDGIIEQYGWGKVVDKTESLYGKVMTV